MGFFSQLTGDFVFVCGRAARAADDHAYCARIPRAFFPIVMEELADKYGDAPALISTREHFTYREPVERSNRYSRWALCGNLQRATPSAC